MPELAANGCTVRSSRANDSSKPKRLMISSEYACCASIGHGPDMNASSPSTEPISAISGTSSVFRSSNTARTSAVFIPGSKSSRRTSYGSS